jgi:hypothetical protein
MTLLVALALGAGASIAAAEVRTQGGGSQGHGGHPVEDRCKQPSHVTKWYCQPATTTPTTNKPVTASAVNPAPTAVVDDLVDPTGSGDSFVALSTPPESPPPAVVSELPPFTDVPELPPFTDVPGFDLPGFDDLLDEGPGGVPFAMALVIAVAGIATIGLVLRGTFGRSPSLPVTDDGESLKFR